MLEWEDLPERGHPDQSPPQTRRDWFKDQTRHTRLAWNTVNKGRVARGEHETGGEPRKGIARGIAHKHSHTILTGQKADWATPNLPQRREWRVAQGRRQRGHGWTQYPKNTLTPNTLKHTGQQDELGPPLRKTLWQHHQKSLRSKGTTWREPSCLHTKGTSPHNHSLTKLANKEG